VVGPAEDGGALWIWRKRGVTLFSRSPPGDRCSCCSFKRRRQKGWRDFEGDRCGWSKAIRVGIPG
jgi:hypothetical protein